jgi:hypothetical protein
MRASAHVLLPSMEKESIFVELTFYFLLLIALLFVQMNRLSQDQRKSLPRLYSDLSGK